MQKLVIVAHIHTQFPEKFGIPRQSGLVPEALGQIVFEPEYRNPDAVKGMEEFSYLWLLWSFSMVKQDKFCATVAPPRLGGKERRGVFATRAPYRPNAIGLSSVKLEAIHLDETLGPVLTVSGVDLLDGTPIYDIKPYLPYTDSHPDALGGFGEAHRDDGIAVSFPEQELYKLPERLRDTALALLEQDPRAAYNKKPDYVYGMALEDYDIRFTVRGNCLTVQEVTRRDGTGWEKIK